MEQPTNYDLSIRLVNLNADHEVGEIRKRAGEAVRTAWTVFGITGERKGWALDQGGHRIAFWKIKAAGNG